MKRAILLATAAIFAMGTMSDMAEAKNKGKNGHGSVKVKVKAKPGKVKIKRGAVAATVIAPGLAVAGHCPPGLAKKDPPCIPPGQARATVPDHGHDHAHDRDVVYDHDHDHGHDGMSVTHTSVTTYNEYNEIETDQLGEVTTLDGNIIRVGDVIYDDYDRYAVLEPVRFGLPPAEADEVYLRVGDAAVKMDSNTQRVLTILTLADLLIE